MADSRQEDDEELAQLVKCVGADFVEVCCREAAAADGNGRAEAGMAATDGRLLGVAPRFTAQLRLVHQNNKMCVAHPLDPVMLPKCRHIYVELLHGWCTPEASLWQHRLSLALASRFPPLQSPLLSLQTTLDVDRPASDRATNGSNTCVALCALPLPCQQPALWQPLAERFCCMDMCKIADGLQQGPVGAHQTQRCTAWRHTAPAAGSAACCCVRSVSRCALVHGALGEPHEPKQAGHDDCGGAPNHVPLGSKVRAQAQQGRLRRRRACHKGCGACTGLRRRGRAVQDCNAHCRASL